ncbi:hypothetical protein [Metabacillus schmidteae]|uniref:hypothetical protein n=1 Tax=Metabacillus schmidteae TaxID=2730405 RepID=UPI00158D14D1|nr:hypothetical protein [Metabacillus schmidteae]
MYRHIHQRIKITGKEAADIINELSGKKIESDEEVKAREEMFKKSKDLHLKHGPMVNQNNPYKIEIYPSHPLYEAIKELLKKHEETEKSE